MCTISSEAAMHLLMTKLAHVLFVFCIFFFNTNGPIVEPRGTPLCQFDGIDKYNEYPLTFSRQKLDWLEKPVS